MFSRIKIIAEIGINHGGQFEIAADLISAAAKAGVHGVKFQYRNLDNAYADGAKQIGDEILLKEITKNYLSPSSIIELVELSHKLGIEAGISFFDVADINDFNGQMGVFDFFKTPSVELLNTTLINSLLAFDKTVYVSLGCHHEVEIEQAFSSFKTNNWIPLHCVSNYPVSLANARLGYLKHMKNKWDRAFGYSSHDENWEVALIAMSMGATVIERHITFDKKADGLDHSTSSTPDEFKKLVEFSDNMQILLAGDANRVPNQGELLNLQNLGRSYYACADIKAGQHIDQDNLVLRSPRIGMGGTEAQSFFGQAAQRDVGAGEVISRSVFQKPIVPTDRAISFAKKKKISIPVRLHDLEQIENKFPVGSYEFHLSFGEVLSGLNAQPYKNTNFYSIHLPDYISSTALMDPFSSDPAQVEGSMQILQRTVDFAKDLQDLTGSKVPVVGSFSVVHQNLETFFEQHAALLDDFRRQGVSILPQWLPPIAWYFGGSVKLNAMNNLQDVDLIKKHQLPICMDICHLCMGDSLFGFNAPHLVEILRPQIEHLHIADAEGIDGEGLHFGEGDQKNMAAINAAMDFDCMKVIEVWQGHLDQGAGFAKAITALAELFDHEK